MIHLNSPIYVSGEVSFPPTNLSCCRYLRPGRHTLMIYIEVHKLFWLFQATKFTISSWEYTDYKIG